MIELEKIYVTAGKFILKNISARFEKGKFHVLLGSSGSGKTVLLETIAGLINPDRGRILLNGQDISHLPPETRKFSYLPQDIALFPNKNVFENIAFGLELNNKISSQEIKNKVLDIAQKLNIIHILNRSIHNLSGGEQQRVALARALVINSPFILLDEPLSALHETMQESFCLLLRNIQKNLNIGILMTTHQKDCAFLVADQLHFIENGELLLSANTMEITTIPLPTKIATLLGISNLLEIHKLANIPNTFYCPQLNTNLLLSKIENNNAYQIQIGVRPIDIRVIKPEDRDKEHINSFDAYVEDILYKENDALVFLKIPHTGYYLKMELSIYNLHKMNIQRGNSIQCKIKEEHIRVIVPD